MHETLTFVLFSKLGKLHNPDASNRCTKEVSSVNKDERGCCDRWKKGSRIGSCLVSTQWSNHIRAAFRQSKLFAHQIMRISLCHRWKHIGAKAGDVSEFHTHQTKEKVDTPRKNSVVRFFAKYT